MDDILGPEDSRDGASLDNSLMEGEVQSGPNYAFVVKYKFKFIKNLFFKKQVMLKLIILFINFKIIVQN